MVRYRVNVESLSSAEFDEVEKKFHAYSQNVFVVDIPTTELEVIFTDNDNINFIKTLFPSSCVFTKID